jgi:hypothetical protein
LSVSQPAAKRPNPIRADAKEPRQRITRPLATEGVTGPVERTIQAANYNEGNERCKTNLQTAREL